MLDTIKQILLYFLQYCYFGYDYTLVCITASLLADIDLCWSSLQLNFAYIYCHKPLANVCV